MPIVFFQKREKISMGQDSSREDRVREEAFMLWNADGRPEGRAEDYWHRAERIIEHQDKLFEEEWKRGQA